MRIWQVALAVAATLTLLTAPASADKYEPDFELNLEGGYQRSMTTLSDWAEDSVGLGVGLGYFWNERLTVGADFHYTAYNLNSDITGAFSGELSLDMAYLEYLAFAKYYLGQGRYRPYLKGGAGVFNGRAKVVYQGLEGTGSATDPGMMGGIGMQVMGNQNSATFIELGYRRVLGDDIQWYGVSVGASFMIW